MWAWFVVAAPDVALALDVDEDDGFLQGEWRGRAVEDHVISSCDSGGLMNVCFPCFFFAGAARPADGPFVWAPPFTGAARGALVPR